MSTFSVKTVSSLLAALKSSKAGDVIALAPGSYGAFTIADADFSGAGVTITSANPNDPAVLTGFTIIGSSGLNLSDLDLSTIGSTTPAPFRVTSSKFVNLTALNVMGSLGNEATISGLLIRTSSNVSVENSIFHYVFSGIQEYDSNNITISNNVFKKIANDGIDNAGSTGVTISNNLFKNFTPAANVHPDAVQFWTSTSDPVSSGIKISDNTMARDLGSPFQGVFVQSGPYDHLGGDAMSNVSIAGNTMAGLLYRAISVQGVNQVGISDNHVTAYTGQESYVVVQSSNTVSVTDNSSMLYVFEAVSNLTQAGNLINRMVAIPAAPSAQSSTGGYAAPSNAQGAPLSTTTPPPPAALPVASLASFASAMAGPAQPAAYLSGSSTTAEAMAAQAILGATRS